MSAYKKTSKKVRKKTDAGAVVAAKSSSISFGKIVKIGIEGRPEDPDKWQ